MNKVIRRLPWGEIERALQVATRIIVAVAKLLIAISGLKLR